VNTPHLYLCPAVRQSLDNKRSFDTAPRVEVQSSSQSRPTSTLRAVWRQVWPWAFHHLAHGRSLVGAGVAQAMQGQGAKP